MLKKEFVSQSEDVLLVSFGPMRAQEKFLFYRAKGTVPADLLFFLDSEDNFYIDHLDEIVEEINARTRLRPYVRVVMMGFSAGAFIAAHLVPLIEYGGEVHVHAFSPHVRLGARYSIAWFHFGGSRDLSPFDLRRNLAGVRAHHRLWLYMPIDSTRDGPHIADSFALNMPSVRTYYLKMDHDTSHIIREDYPAGLAAAVRGEFCPDKRYLASADAVMKSQILNDLYTSELSEKLSRYASASALFRANEESSEFCYWLARQLARSGCATEAIHWGWSAITRSSGPSNTYFETLGHIAFDTGRLPDALAAYLGVSNPGEEVQRRIDVLKRLTL